LLPAGRDRPYPHRPAAPARPVAGGAVGGGADRGPPGGADRAGGGGGAPPRARPPPPRSPRKMRDLAPSRRVSAMPPARRDLSLAVPADLDAELLGDRGRGAAGPDPRR